MSAEEAASPPLNDTPAVDRLWDGLTAWLIGVVAVVGLALAVATTLGWPRRAPAALSATQLAVLSAQAVASSAGMVRAGRALCRRYLGAVVVAFGAGVPVALAVLLGMEWADPREPHASWGRLLGGSVQLAALEAGPVGYVLWHFRRPRARLGGSAPTVAEPSED